MSKLESDCIPIVGSLLEDISLSLDSGHQLLMSIWATKIAMILDSVEEGRDKYYLKSECEDLKSKKDIPKGTIIWIGRYFGRSLHTNGASFTAHLENSAPIADCNTATIVVGHLTIQILSVRVRPEYGDRTIHIEPRPGRWNDLLTSIWPAASGLITWPPNLSFSNYGAYPIADLLFRWRKH